MSLWTHDPQKDKPGRSVKGCFVWGEPLDGIPLKVATVHRNGERIPTSEYFRNIRLIASAPELFELLSVLCKDRAVTRATHEAFAARDKARVLLSAIEGEASDLS